MDKKAVGKKGENSAARYLKMKGYTVVEQNFSCRFGEIDIIAENEDYIVFVEVKARNKNSIAAPREFVGSRKQSRIIVTAQMYLSLHPSGKQPRFDVIEVNTDKIFFKINHIENAFGV
ncbi:MAG: YraN family protein [Clostridia bacterium]|nr:YraN family protein [Clostridia bacterium]